MATVASLESPRWWSFDGVAQSFERNVEWITGKLADAWAWLVSFFCRETAPQRMPIQYPENQFPDGAAQERERLTAFALELFNGTLANPPTVAFECRPSSSDGNCFLTSCIHASGEQITAQQLRRELNNIYNAALRGNAPVDRHIRESFLQAFLLNEAGLGTVIPRFAPWEEYCLEHFGHIQDPNILVRELANLRLGHFIQQPQIAAQQLIAKLAQNRKVQLNDWEAYVVGHLGSNLTAAQREARIDTILQMTPQKLGQVIAGCSEGDVLGNPKTRLAAAQRFLQKRESRAQYFLNGEEQALVVQYGFDALLQPGGAEENLQTRLRNIFTRYTEAAARNGTYNGQFEQLLASRYFQRPIFSISIERRWGKSPLTSPLINTWVEAPVRERIIGEDRFLGRDPLFLAYLPGHYESLQFYRLPQPQARA